MSVTRYPRPYTSAWSGLTRSRMVKSGAGFWRSIGRRLGDVGGGDAPVNTIRTGLASGLGAIKNHPKSLGIPLAIAGITAPTQYGVNVLSESNRRASIAAQAAAAITAAKNKPPPDPDLAEQGGKAVQNFFTKNWMPLTAAGTGLGAAGLWWKNRQDREREAEEEALLTDMHSKTAMVKLAAEFPVQVGFLVRCGERKLTGSEVRAAVEKCASISDAMAEEWTRFFVGAAGLEARATSGMVKAALLPVPTPATLDPVTDPKTPLTQTTGGGLNDTAATAVKAPAPAQVMPNRVMPTREEIGHTLSGSPLPSYSQYRQPFATPPTNTAAMPAAPSPTARAMRNVPANEPLPTYSMYRQPSVTPTATTAPVVPPVTRSPATSPLVTPLAAQAGPYQGNVQRAMATAASEQGEAANKAWRLRLQEADRTGDTTVAAYLRANRPQTAPVGPAGANRPPMTQADILKRHLDDELVANDTTVDEPSLSNLYGIWATNPAQYAGATSDILRRGQLAEQQALAEGMSTGQARKLNLLAPGNDRTWRQRFGGAAAESLGALGGAVSTPFAAVYDAYRNTRNYLEGSDKPQDWSNTTGALLEIADPAISLANRGDPWRAQGYEGLFGRTHDQGTGYRAGVWSNAPGDAAYLASPARQQELTKSYGSLMARRAQAELDKGNAADDGTAWQHAFKGTLYDQAEPIAVGGYGRWVG